MNSDAGQAPTRVRYGVLAFVCALSMITYLDRAAFPSVQGQIGEALGLNNISQLKLAMTAFQLAYALFEVPTGWLGDVFGPRKTLMRIVLWWSFFIALTGLVGRIAGIIAFGYSLPEFTLYGYWMLVAVRFLFGIGEAGAYPNIARAIYNWFPLRERGRASGLVWMSARLMGGLTPLITMLLLVDLNLHWRSVFILFGLLGGIWCLAFGFWFRNRPEEKASVNEAERELIRGDRGPAEIHGGVPWRRILGSRNVWALCLMYFCGNYGWYFSLNYLPEFMESQYSVSRESRLGSLYKGEPLLLGMVGCFVGGWLTDAYVRRTGDRKWGRRLFGIAGHALAAVCMFSLLAIPYRPHFAWLFALTIGLAGFFNDLTMAPSWASCQDVGKRYSAIVSGLMNMIGNLGGALTTYVTGTVLERAIERHAASLGTSVSQLSKEAASFGARAGCETNFILYGTVYALAIIFWMMLNANRPIDSEADRVRTAVA